MFFVYGVAIGPYGGRRCHLLGAAADEETAKRRAAGWFVHTPFDCVYVKDTTNGLIHFFRCTAKRRSQLQPALVLPLCLGQARRRLARRPSGRGVPD